jgi:hypothetical protein
MGNFSTGAVLSTSTPEYLYSNRDLVYILINYLIVTCSPLPFGWSERPLVLPKRHLITTEQNEFVKPEV